MLLAIPVLLAILFLVGAMLKLGPARIRNVSDAERGAYKDAIATASPEDVADDPGPVSDPIASNAAASGLPELPNRLHTATAQTMLNDSFGNIKLPDVTLTDTATFGSPPMIYSSWPAVNDQQAVSEWAQQYAVFSVGDVDDPSSIAGSLDLAPGWPP